MQWTLFDSPASDVNAVLFSVRAGAEGVKHGRLCAVSDAFTKTGTTHLSCLILGAGRAGRTKSM